MTILASATIDGAETTGRAELVQADDGTVTLELHELDVAAGAPDARLYVSTSPEPGFDDSAIVRPRCCTTPCSVSCSKDSGSTRKT